ncbi:hypothetical protein GCM10027418_17010 [Mariniluteicoccus endophyticus]
MSGAVRRFLRLVGVESAKLWTLPAARAALLGAPLVTGLLAAVLADVAGGQGRIDSAVGVGATVTYTQAGPVLLGALVMGHEYAGRQIRTSLSVVPSRWTLLAAKAVAAVGWLAACALGTVVAGHVGVWMGGARTTAGVAPPDVPGAVGLVAHLLLVGLLAHGVATLTRSTAASTASVLALVLVVSLLLRAVTPLARWLPGQVTQRLLDPTATGPSPAVGLAVMLAWAAAVTLLGTLRVVHQDA